MHCRYSEFKDDINRCSEGATEFCHGILEIIFGGFSMCYTCLCYNANLEEGKKIEDTLRIAYGLDT